MIAILTNLLLALGAGLLWWVGNIQMGNVKAIEYLGWLSAYPWYVAWVVAILPSISQLFLTEQWDTKSKKEEKGQEVEPIDPLSMIFAGFVAIVIDLGGPVLGFFVVTGFDFSWWATAMAIVIAAFVSILCQHVAWVRGKKAMSLIFAKAAAKPAKPVQAKPTPLAEKIAQSHHAQHVNGKAKEHASPTKDE